jgi:hypothetical protein
MPSKNPVQRLTHGSMKIRSDIIENIDAIHTFIAEPDLPAHLGSVAAAPGRVAAPSPRDRLGGGRSAGNLYRHEYDAVDEVLNCGAAERP